MYQAAQDLADKALTPFTTGLILLDAQNRVSYHNPEALNILTYLTAAKTPLHVPPRILQSLLPGNNISKLEISHIDFKSGRRRYTARSFVLSHSSGKLEQAVTGILLERVAPSFLGISAAAQQFRLTQREQETVELLTLGLTSKEIANRMKISPNTVKAFFRLVMTKMEVSTRAGIVGKIARVQSLA